MREIKIAKSAGFCFGVKRAVNLVYDQVGNAKKVYTYGPIIHNEEVVSDLERKGVVEPVVGRGDAVEHLAHLLLFGFLCTIGFHLIDNGSIRRVVCS